MQIGDRGVCQRMTAARIKEPYGGVPHAHVPPVCSASPPYMPFLNKRGGPICRLLMVCGLAGMGMTARAAAQPAWKPRS